MRFWLVALAGLFIPPAISYGMRRVADRRQRAANGPGLVPRLQAAGVRFMAAVIALALFLLLYWAALSMAAAGALFLQETADHLFWTVLKWRLLVIALLVVVSPNRADLRLLAIDEAGARRCARWITPYLVLNPFNVFIIWLVERVGFGHAAVFGAAFALGIPITLYKVVMFWAIREPIARAIRSSSCGAPSPFRNMVADSWHWLFIALAFAVFGADTVEFALGKGAAMAGAGAATQFIFVALAVLWPGGPHLIAHLFPDPGPDIGLAMRRTEFRRVLSPLFNALLWIFGVAWLGETWGLDLVHPAPGSIERMVVRPAFEAAATIVGAWILWAALSAVIDEKIPHVTAPGGEDDAAAGPVSRVGTLLPSPILP